MKVIFATILAFTLAMPISAAELTAPEVPSDVQHIMPEQPDSFADGLIYIIKQAVFYIEPSLADASGICAGLIAVSLLVSQSQLKCA